MLIKETSDMTAVERQTIRNQNNLYLETGIQKILDDGYNIDELKFNGKFAILNATGTLPSGYSVDDNNIFVENFMWFEHYGRQILHDVRTNKTFSRNLFNDVWQPFEFVDCIVDRGETGVDGIAWSWEKWNSGKAVCWGVKHLGTISITTAWGNLYESVHPYTALYPDGLFIEPPTCQMCAYGSGGVLLETSGVGTKSQTAPTFLVRPVSANFSGAKIEYYIDGRWK